MVRVGLGLGFRGVRCSLLKGLMLIYSVVRMLLGVMLEGLRGYAAGVYGLCVRGYAPGVRFMG